MPNFGMESSAGLSRRAFLTTSALAGLACLAPGVASAQNTPAASVSLDDVRAALRLAGISFTEEELRETVDEIRSSAEAYAEIRTFPIQYKTEPLTRFVPHGATADKSPRVRAVPGPVRLPDVAKLSEEDIAFLTIGELHGLLKARKITSTELTRLSLSRLRRYDKKLLCVAHLCSETALKEAAQADAEIRTDKMRGPLHGIPYGLKDLFATRDHPTGWGAEPYRGQMLGEDATVVQILRSAGAVLVAKLTLGALAMGDRWYGGMTRNPWNPVQGSSGSSAGSASAVAAGLVPYAIGSETLGSICSPSLQCRVTGLRPTYGRISRYGAMALSYTMDKVGPIARTVEDCALVFATLCGADSRDPSAVSHSFSWPPRVDPKKLRIGVVLPEKKTFQDYPIFKLLVDRGYQFRIAKITPAPNALSLILSVECASAFDSFTRGDEIRELKNSYWPQYFRSARVIPAVEYLQAQRLRTLVAERFAEEMQEYDLLMTPGIGLQTILLTNMTGHPQCIIPDGVEANGVPRSWSIIAGLFQEALAMAFAQQLQGLSEYHEMRPTIQL